MGKTRKAEVQKHQKAAQSESPVQNSPHDFYSLGVPDFPPPSNSSRKQMEIAAKTDEFDWKRPRDRRVAERETNQQEDKAPKRSQTSSLLTASVTNVTLRRWGPDLLASAASGFLLLSLYIRTLYPSIAGGDSGELIIAANEFGVAHPPGYPVFTMMAKLMIKFFPFGNPAYKVNMLTAILSSAAGFFLQLTVLRLTGCYGSSIAAVASFCLSELTWTWSITAEVFGLNNFMISILIFLSVIFDQETDAKKLVKIAIIGAFTCGLTLCNQHTTVFYVAVIALWVLGHLWWAGQLSVLTLLQLSFAFIAGLLPYVYLPIAAWYRVARWTWGDTSTVQGFFTHLLRREYGTFDLGKRMTGLGFVHGMSTYVSHVVQTMGTWMFGPVLLLLAVICTSRRAWLGGAQVPVVFLVMLTSYQCFFAWRANLDVSRPLFLGVVERFWMQSDIIVCLLSALGLHEVLRFFHELFGSKGNCSSKQLLAGIIAAVLTVLQLNRNFAVCDQSNNYVIRDFAMHTFDTLPQNALVLNKGDLPTNSMRYLHLCENVRPDLQLLDLEVLTYKWSIRMMGHAYPKVTFPGAFLFNKNAKLQDGTLVFDVKRFLDKNFKKFSGVYACIGLNERRDSWKKGYITLPNGACSRLLPIESTINPTAWASTMGRIGENWPYANNVYDSRSWEKVANDEMWQSKIAAPYFLFKKAADYQDKTEQAAFYISAYKLYKSALARHEAIDVPSFWHKNFALACEKLLYYKHDISKLVVTKESIKHFEIYVDQVSEDKDLPQIIKAIHTLKKRIAVYEKLDKVDDITGKL